MKKLKNVRKKLKGNGIYINDDFTPVTLERRKHLLKAAKDLREQGKGATVVSCIPGI